MSAATPIRGRACGKWVAGVGSCAAPEVYRCPLCGARACFPHSPAARPPSKRRCCWQRQITDGEVEAWRSGDIAHATALIIKAWIPTQLGRVSLLTHNARQIEHDNVKHAIEAAHAWAMAGTVYIGIQDKDPAQAALWHQQVAACARNAGICAKFAQEWAGAKVPAVPRRRAARRGLIIIDGGEPRVAPEEAP